MKTIVRDGVRLKMVKEYFNTTDGRWWIKYRDVNTHRIHKCSRGQFLWEQHNGKLPYGYDVHHKDGNKTNDVINNLEAIESSIHFAMHSKMKSVHRVNRNGIQEKRCVSCKQMKTKESFYIDHDGEWHSCCRQCDKQQKVEKYRNKFKGVVACCGSCFYWRGDGADRNPCTFVLPYSSIVSHSSMRKEEGSSCMRWRVKTKLIKQKFPRTGG